MTAAMIRLKPVWNDRSISLSSKTRLVRSLVTSIFLYACESWTLTAKLQRLQAMEIRYYRKILPISYKNGGVFAKIQQATGPHEDLTVLKRRKLKWYGHVFLFIQSGQNHLARHSERVKKTRQTEKRWEDNIKEWTGPEFAKS